MGLNMQLLDRGCYQPSAHERGAQAGCFGRSCV